MDCQSRYRAFSCRRDRELRTWNDIARGKNVLYRRVIAVVDDDQSCIIALAAQLSADVIGGNLADGEVEPLAVE